MKSGLDALPLFLLDNLLIILSLVSGFWDNVAYFPLNQMFYGLT